MTVTLSRLLLCVMTEVDGEGGTFRLSCIKPGTCSEEEEKEEEEDMQKATIKG